MHTGGFKHTYEISNSGQIGSGLGREFQNGGNMDTWFVTIMRKIGASSANGGSGNVEFCHAVAEPTCAEWMREVCMCVYACVCMYVYKCI